MLTVVLMCLRERNRRAVTEEKKEEEEMLEDLSAGSEMASDADD